MIWLVGGERRLLLLCRRPGNRSEVQLRVGGEPSTALDWRAAVGQQPALTNDRRWLWTSPLAR
jgi:hypothetical protein